MITGIVTRTDGPRIWVQANANVDQVVIVQSARQPNFKIHLVERFLALARRGRMNAIVVVNKCDLEPEPVVRSWTAPLKQAGVEVFLTSAPNGRGIPELRTRLQGRVSVFAGQSGVGKSSLVNTLYPDAAIQTAAISDVTNKGRHKDPSRSLSQLPAPKRGSQMKTSKQEMPIMQFQIRPFREPDDFTPVAALITAIEPEPISSEELARWHGLFPAEGIRTRLVAVDSTDQVIGYAGCSHTPEAKIGKFYLTNLITADARRHGVGTALLTAAEGFAHSHGATLLSSDVRDSDPASLAWAKRRSYEIDRHLYESVLNPSTFDDSSIVGTLDALKVTGIRIFSVADEPGEQTERKLYELSIKGSADMPGYDNERPVPYERWRKWTIENPDVTPDCLLIAADGDRFVGVSMMHHIKANGGLYTAHTSVDREYRGRGIALGLKVAAIQVGRRLGVPHMRTNNHSTNAPMLSVNRKLGYEPVPGVYLIDKRF